MTARSSGLHSLTLIVALVAVWQLLYWWVGDVALASPLATFRYTATLFASESFEAHLFDTLKAFAIAYALSVLIGVLLGIVAVIVTTLNGLDRVPRVLRKTAAIARLSPLETALRVTLPFCAPYLLSAAKLAIAYAFIGVIGSEFIMARTGMGYEIGFAYTNFDNATMYPLIVLILLLSIIMNGVLTRWEKVLLARRGQ